MRKRDITVCHPPTDTANPAIRRRAYAYGQGRMRVLQKHNFPLWFKLANVFYSLAALPVDIVTKGSHVLSHRWSMFWGRLTGMLWKDT